MGEQILLNQDCQEPPYNPKQGYRRRAGSYRFAEPSSPIPAQVEDVKDIREFFGKYKDVYVPYAGTDKHTSHSLQAFLNSLLELSPTHGACADKIQKLCFGGKVDFVRRLDPVYNLEGDPEVSAAEKLRFYEFVKKLKAFDSSGQEINLRRLAKNNYWSLAGDGNYFIELQRSVVAGMPQFSAIIRKNEHCLYLATDTGQQRWLAVSPIWREDYILRYPPQYVPLYPLWAREADGFERTMIHVKNGEKWWYGRPATIGALLDKYYEFQASDYKSKQTAAAFIGQVFIEVEDTDPQYDMGDESAMQDGYDSLAEQFEQNHTNRAERPQTVVLSTRPFGSKQAFVFQFSPNTNENWYKVTQEVAETNIIKAHGVSRRIMGMDVAAGLNTNAYLEEFEILSATTFRDIQETISEPINNIILAEAALHFGQQDMLEYSLQFNSPFSEMIKERKDAAKNNNNGGGSGPVQPGEPEVPA
ncbi:MAG: hypothetical protein KDD28_15125 [Phaeodactylibacter sp.]|nr:hypothetical protein [Phaeodactylibacter sp.]